MDQAKIITAITQSSRQRQRPDGSTYLSLPLKDALLVSGKFQCSLYRVEDYALDSGIIPERYARNQRFLTTAEQQKLHQLHVGVIGLGGLGGSVTEILARLGVGRFTLVDGDCFDESNLNRQLLCTVEQLNRPKAEVAGERVKSINPAAEVNAIKAFFTEQNCTELTTGIDCLVDGLDTIQDRFLLEKICGKRQIPLVSAAIGGTAGQITTIFPGSTRLSTIYGTAGKSSGCGSEGTTGTLACTAVTIAALECMEVLKIATGRKTELRNNLLFLDLMDYSTVSIPLE